MHETAVWIMAGRLLTIVLVLRLRTQKQKESFNELNVPSVCVQLNIRSTLTRFAFNLLACLSLKRAKYSIGIETFRIRVLVAKTNMAILYGI
jgi:hypothetical protein